MKKILFFIFGIVGLVCFLFAMDVQFGKKEVHEAKAAAGDTLQVDTFTTSGTWMAPVGVTSVLVEAWGGGANGATNLGGGGGGAYVSSTVAVTPGTTYWIQVGKAAPGSGMFGTTSTFATTTVVAAPGWGAAGRSLGGAVASSTGDTIFAGAAGELGTGNRTGGGAAGDQASGSAAVGGSRNGTSAERLNVAGAFFGVGGGSTSASFGSVGPGQVRVTYTSSVSPLYPVVVKRAWGGTTVTSTSHSIELPPSVAIGDLLLIVFGTNGAANTSTISAGWTSLAQTSGTVVTESIFYKIATGSDSATVTTANPVGSSFISLRIQNGGVPTATSTFGTSAAADSPNLDTGLSGKYIWFSTQTISAVGQPSASITTAPATFTSFITQPNRSLSVAGARVGAGVAVSELFAEASSVDPGAWSNANRAWVASTIAIPFSGSGPTPGAVAGPTRRQRIIFIQ